MSPVRDETRGTDHVGDCGTGVGLLVALSGKATATLGIIAALAALSTAALSSPVHADVSGPAAVIDGDTIEVGGNRIRLHGIDAPESAQDCLAGGRLWRCGRHATRALRGRMADRSVACEEWDRDRYGRVVAVCRLGGTDLNAWMVSEGWALAYRRYSRKYVAEEALAKAARRGLWRGEFVAPWNWRAGQRLQPVRRGARSDTGRNRGGCRIKGNISRAGARVYHVPGGRYYERTKINPSRGERWFCSEAEARSAGWRQSRR
jgi:endonuclease YncB( thermonuclease family)